MLLVGVSILLTVTSFSQEAESANGVHFGVKAGINVANVTIKSMGLSISPSSLIGPTAGFFATIPVADGFAVQPELTYSGLGFKINTANAKQVLNYLTVPVLAKYTFESSGFGAYVGPQIGFLLSAKAKENGSPSADNKDDLKSTDFSGIVGVEYTLPIGFNVSARYQIGFSNIAKDASSDETLKNKALIFTVGFRF